jgi:hypothetical protein
VACGIFLIVPFFAGLAALALAIVGTRQINESNQLMRGRRLAVAGAILGIVNILGWGVYFKFISEISGPGRAVANHFIDDLDSANPAEAQRECLQNIHANRLEAAAKKIKTWGGVKTVAVLYITSDTADGNTTGSVRGTLRTPTGPHAFWLQTDCDADSACKIKDFSLQ